MEISELLSFSSEDCAELAGLMAELDSSASLTERSLRELIDSADSHLYVVRSEEGRIVGCACLCVYFQPFRMDASMESVVVSSSCRRAGLGRRLVEFLIEEAGRLGVARLHLTSRPARVAANALYQAVGFTRKDTNCYVLDLGHL